MIANEKRQLKVNKFGVPNAPQLAIAHHKENLPVVVKDALAKGNLESVSELEAIAVTIGPGQ